QFKTFAERESCCGAPKAKPLPSQRSPECKRDACAATSKGQPPQDNPRLRPKSAWGPESDGGCWRSSVKALVRAQGYAVPFGDLCVERGFRSSGVVFAKELLQHRGGRGGDHKIRVGSVVTPAR